jgi:hypothetical protein
MKKIVSMPYFICCFIRDFHPYGQEVQSAVPLKSNYDYHDAFAPFFIQKWNNNTVRRSTGAEYWQNRADYSS